MKLLMDSSEYSLFLGFIGHEYINENNKSEFSKNHKFGLKGLKILTDLNGNTMMNLDEGLKIKYSTFNYTL